MKPRKSLRRMLAVRLAGCLLLTVLAALASPLLGGPAAISVTTTDPHVQPGSWAADVLASTHDCWRAGEPAKAAWPGHVVVTTEDGHTVYSAKYVHQALEQVFHGRYPNLVVHAFCR